MPWSAVTPDAISHVCVCIEARVGVGVWAVVVLGQGGRGTRCLIKAGWGLDPLIRVTFVPSNLEVKRIHSFSGSFAFAFCVLCPLCHRCVRAVGAVGAAVRVPPWPPPRPACPTPCFSARARRGRGRGET